MWSSALGGKEQQGPVPAVPSQNKATGSLGAASEKEEVALSKLPPSPKATRKGGTFLLCAAWPLQGPEGRGGDLPLRATLVEVSWRLADTGLSLHSHVQGQHEEGGSDRV